MIMPMSTLYSLVQNMDTIKINEVNLAGADLDILEKKFDKFSLFFCLSSIE